MSIQLLYLCAGRKSLLLAGSVDIFFMPAYSRFKKECFEKRDKHLED